MSIHRLLPLIARARSAQEPQPLVLATVIRTAGSTYAKPGAQMLIARDGEYAGLLSGGCLEGDLREHAREVAATGQARIVSYDMRTPDDQLFGLGSGCEGAMDVLLTRQGAASGWRTLELLEGAYQEARTVRVGFVTASADDLLPMGTSFAVDTAADPGGPGAPPRDLLTAAASAAGNSLVRVEPRGVELFVADIAPPPRILLLGAGPDARPVATLAGFLGWRITVVDHRAAYLDPARFPPGTALVETDAAELPEAVPLEGFAAAIVMSHHLESDLHYLRALAQADVPYVGLLGPAARREKLLGDLGDPAPLLRSRLRAPVGLDIGGRAPESIALSIVGEIHAVLAGRGGRPFSETAN